jgi:hypothetical protein
MRPKAWIYGRSPGNTGALQVKQMLEGRVLSHAQIFIIRQKMQTVLIVLGFPPKEDGTIPYNLKTRLDLAITEYKSHPGSILLLTGGAAYGKRIEAIEMAKYCCSMGIPENCIWLEKKARSTYDNALYTAQMLQGHKVDKVIIITSRYHRMRTDIIFRNYYREYSISIPKLTLGYLLKNSPIYLWEIYLTLKLKIHGDQRLDRKLDKDATKIVE